MTRPSRRALLRLATTAAAALPALPRRAFALDYPARPVHLIIGFAAGGPTDVAARVIGQWLSEKLGQPLRKLVQRVASSFHFSFSLNCLGCFVADGSGKGF